MSVDKQRRAVLRAVGIGVAVGAIGSSAAESARAEAALIPAGAARLEELTARLAKAPRRRDFKTVPMILQSPDDWDHEALTEVLGYRGEPKQVWDNTDIGGPWLNVMRNSLNAQVFAFKHRDCLLVSATHGSAHFALYDQAIWDKYGIAKFTAGKFARNSLIGEDAPAAEVKDIEDPAGPYGKSGGTISGLMRRGVVFMACHNAIWEQANLLIEHGANPDNLSHPALAAELTNHLLPGVVLTPGMVATTLELQRAGFHYAK